jgi:hypothetical protein
MRCRTSLALAAAAAALLAPAATSQSADLFNGFEVAQRGAQGPGHPAFVQRRLHGRPVRAGLR